LTAPAAPPTEERPRRRARSTLREYYSSSPSVVTLALLVFPVFAIYQIGVPFSPVLNGVDLVTTLTLSLVERSLLLYLGLNGLLIAAFVGVLFLGRARGGFDARVFAPLLVESGIYALCMGSLIVFVMRELLGLGSLLAIPAAAAALNELGLLDRIVVSCGAGFHEELIFRLILFGGMAWLLERGLGARRWLALGSAALVSAFLFSLVHHLGSLGEPFAMGPFVYRFLSGLFFAALLKARNFAVAVYTHTIYDIFVLVFG